ncbi:MAG TPA: hypothetical protein VHQ65_03920 [Thermoanaerobaculia bacterium]|nr:hypothetical protein [Thermoanaerobaculia bacterium]
MKLLVYEGFERAGAEVAFAYRSDGRVWHLRLGLGDLAAPFAELPAEAARHLLAHTGVAFARYLFPLDDFDQLHVEPVHLPPSAARFHERSLLHHLAETRYRHGLPVTKRVGVTSSPLAQRSAPLEREWRDEALLLDGGGKDSAVAAEALKAAGVPFTWLAVGSPPSAAQHDLAAASGNPRLVVLEHRAHHPEIHDGAPYPEMLAPRLGVLAVLAAAALGTRWVVLANERSAGFANLTVDGLAVNHQWGKSLAAERAFADHAERHLVRGLGFFSLLAPLWEIQIARIFARYPAYHRRFLSCNLGQRRGAWCGHCPKCAFVYLLLAAFLPADEVAAIFGGELLASPRIRYWVERLTRGRKPFECVGTREEARLALSLALERLARPAQVAPEAWARLRELAGERRPADRRMLTEIHLDHRIPSELAPAVLAFFRRELAAPLGSGPC